MMSKTHISIGTACALFVAFNHPSPGNACLAIAGGAVGGILPDIDIVNNDKTGDAILGQVLATIIVIISFFIDKIFSFNAYSTFGNNKYLLYLGIFLFVVLYLYGMISEHRGFTHSVFALVSYSISILIIFIPILPFFMVGYFSHLLVDLLNKRGIQLFYPLKNKICLGLCYADKTANHLLMLLGMILTILLFVAINTKLYFG